MNSNLTTLLFQSGGLIALSFYRRIRILLLRLQKNRRRKKEVITPLFPVAIVVGKKYSSQKYILKCRSVFSGNRKDPPTFVYAITTREIFWSLKRGNMVILKKQEEFTSSFNGRKFFLFEVLNYEKAEPVVSPFLMCVTP